MTSPDMNPADVSIPQTPGQQSPNGFKSAAAKAVSKAASPWLLPLIFGVGGLLIWEFGLWATNPERFLLPRPSEIISVLSEDDRGVDNTIFESIFEASRTTGFIILSSLVAGVILGVAAALITTRFRATNEVITPLAVAMNATPIVALAPIFNNWLGLTSPRSNQAVVVLIVFFPVFINTARGLNTVDPNQIELMQSLASKPWTIIRRVRIPSALPFFFTALKLVSSLCVVAAIVAEYFGGSQSSLGSKIITYAGFTQYDAAWAAVLAGSIIGIVLYALASVAERLAMPWAHRSWNSP